MKFFVDHQLPPALAEWLRAKGHEATTARASGLRSIDDAEIWRHAQRFGLVIISKDEDFADFALTKSGCSVLWVRIGNAVNRILLARFESVWPEIVGRLEAGDRLIELR